MPRTTTSRQRAEHVADRLAHTDPSQRQWRSGAELRRIEAALETAASADAHLRETVRAARAADYSWAAIGAALGVSKQAAQQRFG
jgi:dihydroxyacetone kinase